MGLSYGPPAVQAVSGTVNTTPATTASAAVSNVTSSATSVQLLAVNSNRHFVSVYNESTAILYIKFGTTASATSYTVPVGPNGFWEAPGAVYTGEIDGIWTSANGFARITEI